MVGLVNVSVQVKYTLYTVSGYQQLMKCNGHQLLQISYKGVLSRRKEIKKS